MSDNIEPPRQDTEDVSQLRNDAVGPFTSRGLSIFKIGRLLNTARSHLEIAAVRNRSLDRNAFVLACESLLPELVRIDPVPLSLGEYVKHLSPEIRPNYSSNPYLHVFEVDGQPAFLWPRNQGSEETEWVGSLTLADIKKTIDDFRLQWKTNVESEEYAEENNRAWEEINENRNCPEDVFLPIVVATQLRFSRFVHYPVRGLVARNPFEKALFDLGYYLDQGIRPPDLWKHQFEETPPVPLGPIDRNVPDFTGFGIQLEDYSCYRYRETVSLEPASNWRNLVRACGDRLCSTLLPLMDVPQLEFDDRSTIQDVEAAVDRGVRQIVSAFPLANLHEETVAAPQVDGSDPQETGPHKVRRDNLAIIRAAIEEIPDGIHAKSATIIKHSKVRRQNGLTALRELKALGEYKGPLR